MDIEGAEIFIAESLISLPRSARLPYQISVETHGNGGNASLPPDGQYGYAQEFHRLMAKLGYVAITKEQNNIWGEGWEWTWVRAYCDLEGGS
jgi:hypothetical protein